MISLFWPFVLVFFIIFVLARHESKTRRNALRQVDEICIEVSDRIARLSFENAALKERLQHLEKKEDEE